MLLAADVGNTNITLGVFAGERLLALSRLYTDRMKTDDQYATDLRDVLSLNNIGGSFQGAVIGSVVPELTGVLRDAVSKAIGKTPMIVQSGLKTGLKIKIDNPKELGADLVAGAVGAVAKYPLPCLIMDLGTATKLSVIDEDGAFLGCTIAPGLGISLDALSKSASLLSSIGLEAPTHAIGTNSVDSIRSGTVLGTAAMLDGMTDILEAELKKPFKTIAATGGLAGEIIPACRKSIVLNKTLIIEGLYEIYRKNRA